MTDREKKIEEATRNLGRRVFIAESRHDLLGDNLQACYHATAEENLAAIRKRVAEVRR